MTRHIRPWFTHIENDFFAADMYLQDLPDQYELDSIVKAQQYHEDGTIGLEDSLLRVRDALIHGTIWELRRLTPTHGHGSGLLQKLPKQERSKIASLGGKARWANTTKEERSEFARKRAFASHRNRRKRTGKYLKMIEEQFTE